MDTFKDKQRLDEMESRGNTPWAVWKRGPEDAVAVRAPVNAVPRPGRSLRSA
jgi:hypothetical protein